MKNHNKNNPINDEVLGTALSQSLQKKKEGDCLSPEEIAALVEGKISAPDRDLAMKHLASCKTCCDTFVLSSDMQPESRGKTAIPYRPLALAASVLIVILSLFILYKSGLISKKTITLMEKEEPVIGKIQPMDTDHIDEKDDSAMDYTKKGAIEKAPAKRDRIEKKKAETGREEIRKKIVSKKGYDTEKPKPELPGTQRQIDVPYPQVPRKEGRSKKAGQKKQIEIKEQTAVPIESETGKNQMVQTESVQTEGNLQVRQSSEDTISAKKALLSQVMSVHADGSKKVVNNYIQISGKQTLKEIVEYDEKGRIILIQNPETQVEKKFGYFPDGKKKLQEEYKNGKPHGNWIRWNKKGEILSNRIYKKGKLKKKIK